MAESLPPVCYVVVQPHAEEATCADSGRHPGQAYKQKIRANSVKGLCNKTLKLYFCVIQLYQTNLWKVLSLRRGGLVSNLHTVLQSTVC